MDLTKFRSRLTQRGLRPGTINLYCSDMEMLSRHKVSDSRSLQRYLSSRKIAPATKNRYLTAFKAFQKANGTPCILPAIRAASVTKELPAWERVEKAIAGGGQRGLLVWLLVSTGARVSEAISVVVPKDNSMRLPVTVKGGHEAALVVTEPELWEALKSADGPYVFGGSEPISRNTAYDWVKASCGCSPHALRHLFATTLNKNGASLIAIRDLLNHRSIKTTSRYTHPDLAQLMEEHRKLTLAQ